MSDGEVVSVRDENARRARRWVAALVSLLAPGSGHAARGLVRRGALWLGAMTVAVMVTVWVPHLLFVVMAIWLATIVDAWRAPDGPWLPRGGVALGLIVAFAGGMFALRIGLRSFYAEAYNIPSGGMLPTLEIGDHVFASKISGGAEPGDVVVFVNPCEPDKDFVKRVVAVGGDRVEVRCGVLHVNGEAVERERIEGPDSCRYWDHDWDLDEWSERTCTRYRDTLANGVSFEVFGPERTDEPDGHDFPQVDVPGGEGPTLPRCAPGGVRRELVGAFEDSGEGGDACAPTTAYVVPDGHFFVMGDNRQNSSDSRVWGPVPNGLLVGHVVSIWWSSQPEEAGGTQWGRIGRLP